MKNALIILTIAAASLAGLTLWGAAPAAAQGGSDIQQNLDKSVNVTITDQPIREVFERLEDATGAKFTIDADTFERLPYGEQTRLRVTLKNITLRNALSPMLAPQALQWAVDGNTVRISPSEALYRMCRRATYEELQLLGRLNSGKLDAPTGGDAEKRKAVLEQLQKLTEAPELNIDLLVKDLNMGPFVKDEDKINAAFARGYHALPGTPAAFLDALSGSDMTWYLNGQSIVVLPRKDQVERQLQQHVTLKYQNEKLSDVLLDLARKARVQLTIEPGVMQLLPAEQRSNFSITMSDATIAQALEVISGSTGLKFTHTETGLGVEAGRLGTATTGPAQRPRSPWMLQMDLDIGEGKTVRVMMRAEELPDDLREAIEAKKNVYVQDLRSKLVKNHKPTTTSAPADDIKVVPDVPEGEAGGH